MFPLRTAKWEYILKSCVDWEFFFWLVKVCGLFLLSIYQYFLHYTTLSCYWMLPLRLFLKIKYILIFSTALIYSSFYLNHCEIEGFIGNNYISSWINSYYLFIFVHNWKKIPFPVRRSVYVASVVHDIQPK